MDLISRQEALDAIDKMSKEFYEIAMPGAEHIMSHYARRIIEELPSVALERQKGEWNYHIEDSPYAQDSTVQCSLCGRIYFCEDFGGWRYCPSCGGEMEV